MDLFDFTKLKYDAIVVLDGKLPSKEIIEGFEVNNILAADGAAIQLLNMGIEPDKVIGDLDSLRNKGYDNKINKKKIIYLPDQNSNDFEKVMNFAIENKLNKLLILGIHGGELEHTLNNWSVFIRYAKKLKLYIYDANRFGFAIFDKISLLVNIGEIISLIPQPKAILTTKGLEWELNNQKLDLGYNEGARNKAVSELIEIEIHKGSVLFFCDFKFSTKS